LVSNFYPNTDFDSRYNIEDGWFDVRNNDIWLLSGWVSFNLHSVIPLIFYPQKQK
jgi:hypothetical protein